LTKLGPPNGESLIGADNIAIIRETLAELDDEDGMTKIDLETYQFNQSKAPTPGADGGPPSKHASQLSLASQADPSQGHFSAYALPEDDAPAEQQQQKLPDVGKTVKDDEKAKPQPALSALGGLKGPGFEAIREAHNEEATFED